MVSHAAVALRHGVLGIITCRSPKACPRKKPVIFSFSCKCPHTQKTRSTHGCLRLESWLCQHSFDWHMFAHVVLVEKCDTHSVNYFLSLCKRLLKQLGKSLFQCLPLVCWLGRLLLGYPFFPPWMPWIPAATFFCVTIFCHCLLTGILSWDVQFMSLS